MINPLKLINPLQLVKTYFAAVNKTNDGSNQIARYHADLKGFLVCNLWLEYGIAGPVEKYLAENYFFMCSQHKVAYEMHDVFQYNNRQQVIYKVPRGEVFYFYRGAIIKSSLGRGYSNSGYITFIRGTVNIAKLVNDAKAYEASKPKVQNDVIYFDKFKIIELHGTVDTHDKTAKNLKDVLAPESAESSDSRIFKTDKILNYKYSDLMPPKNSDPFENYYYPQEVTDLVSDTNEWLKRKDWFLERGLPWKRGILLYGPGGTGKSSLAVCMAEKFGLPIYQLYLAYMTDEEFKRAWEQAVNGGPSIVLIEDFDAIFNKRKPVNSKTKLSFDTVLNTISGVKSSTGVILIVTTNHIENIDDAFGAIKDDGSGISTRPGRIDRVLYLGAMDDINRKRLITKILKGWDDLIEEVYATTENYTAAQVQEVCIRAAITQLHDTGFKE